MTTTRPRTEAARIYLREWMTARNVPDQKRLAELMQVAPGTVSKKLSDPSKIDLQWLAEFALALDVRAQDLLVDPSTMSGPLPLRRPRLDELMDFAAQATDAQLVHLIRLMRSLSGSQVDEPQEEQSPAAAAAPQATAKSK